MAVELHRSIHQHPGPWLRAEVLAHYGMTVTAAADHLKVTRPALSNLLNGKAALSLDMAIRFEKAFGVSAATLLRMQANYDLAHADELANAIEVERVPEPA